MNNTSPHRPTLVEPLSTFALVLAAIFTATALASLWPPLSNHLVAIAAGCFIGVPYLILTRKKEDLHRFGIALDELPKRHIALGLLVTVLIFPLFALGNHLWETKILDRELHLSLDNLRQWPMELEAMPVLEDAAAVQVRRTRGQLHISLMSLDGQTPQVFLEGDRPFTLAASGALIAEGQDGPPSTSWRLEPTAKDRLGRATLSTTDQPAGSSLPRVLSIRVDDPAAALIAGAQEEAPDQPLTLKRSYWWIILWSLTHLILVGLPEEYFYRGYLQTRLADFFDDGPMPARFLGLSRANLATSALFAIGHVLIPIGGAFLISRAAVFFPSLIFGWMREQTQSILAPAIFHAGANMMVLIVTVHYF